MNCVRDRQIFEVDLNIDDFLEQIAFAENSRPIVPVRPSTIKSAPTLVSTMTAMASLMVAVWPMITRGEFAFQPPGSTLIEHDAAFDLVFRLRQIERRERLFAMPANFIAREIVVAAGRTNHEPTSSERVLKHEKICKRENRDVR